MKITINSVLLRTLHFLFFSYASFSYGIETGYGSGYFKYTRFDNFEWHVDSNGNAIIDKVEMQFSPFAKPYPCQAAWELESSHGTGPFTSCKLLRTIWSGRDHKDTVLFTSTNIKQLTVAQLVGFLTTTGNVGGGFGNAKVGSIEYVLVINTKYSSGPNYLPMPGSGGIPITPVEPPTSCYVSSTTLSHNTLSVNDLQGNTANGSLMITCNKAASVRINVIGYNHSSGLAITNDRSLISRLTLDGTPADRVQNVSVPGTAFVNVSSVLEKNGSTVTPGSYSKALVVSMTIN